MPPRFLLASLRISLTIEYTYILYCFTLLHTLILLFIVELTINIKRFLETKIKDTILENYINSIKKLLNLLIREIKKNIIIKDNSKVLLINNSNIDLFRSYYLYLREILKYSILI